MSSEAPTESLLINAKSASFRAQLDAQLKKQTSFIRASNGLKNTNFVDKVHSPPKNIVDKAYSPPKVYSPPT